MQRKSNESGVLMLEMAIYFPLIMIAFLMFVIASILVTQQVVLDRAVATAASEGAALIGSSMDLIGNDPIGGEIGNVRAPDFLDIFRLDPSFNPLGSRGDFEAAVANRASYLAGQGIANNWVVDLDAQANFSGYWFAGDLTVEATQRVRFPIQGFGTEFWDLESSATVRVFQPYTLLNRVHFMFDAVRWFTGTDVSNLGDWLQNQLSGLIENLAERAVEFIGDAVLGFLG